MVRTKISIDLSDHLRSKIEQFLKVLISLTCLLVLYMPVKIIKYTATQLFFLSKLRGLGVNDQANYVYSQAITAQMCVNSPRIRVANLAYEVYP